MNRLGTYVRTQAKKLPFARRIVNYLRGRRIHRRDITLQDCILGSGYGGWSVDISRITPGSIVYSVGVGEDISFDLALIERAGCRIHVFDPTPISVEWMKRQALPDLLIFHEIGLAATNGEIDFQLPSIKGEHSYSLVPDPATTNRGIVRCQVRTLRAIMKDLNHSSIDLIKMDIEGFEYEVLENMMQEKIRPKYILVEFHHTLYGIKREKTKALVRQLKEYHYKIYWISEVGLEYGFVDCRT
jgi:FkbM family methyltransferase